MIQSKGRNHTLKKRKKYKKKNPCGIGFGGDELDQTIKHASLKKYT